MKLNLSRQQNVTFWAGALVYRLCEETYLHEAVCSNPGTGYGMDIFHMYCCKNCTVC